MYDFDIILCTQYVGIKISNTFWDGPHIIYVHQLYLYNCAARLITRTRKYEHITPVLRLLHWLPIRQRTLYKLLVLTYCAVNATAPSYLVQLLHNRTVSRTLRSGSSTDLLSVPPSRTVTHGDRCFSVASPTLWNNLPVSLRTAKCLTQFRSQLKTHLFKVAFT